MARPRRESPAPHEPALPRQQPRQHRPPAPSTRSAPLQSRCPADQPELQARSQQPEQPAQAPVSPLPAHPPRNRRQLNQRQLPRPRGTHRARPGQPRQTQKTEQKSSQQHNPGHRRHAPPGSTRRKTQYSRPPNDRWPPRRLDGHQVTTGRDDPRQRDSRLLEEIRDIEIVVGVVEHDRARLLYGTVGRGSDDRHLAGGSGFNNCLR